MRITVYWVTRNPDVIVRIRKKFNIPSYTSVNYETECEINKGGKTKRVNMWSA